MASTAPTRQRATPMPRRDPRLLEVVHDYPMTIIYLLLVAWVTLILAVVEALS